MEVGVGTKRQLLTFVIMASSTIGAALSMIGCSDETTPDAGVDASVDLSSIDLASVDLSTVDAPMTDAGHDDAGPMDAGTDAGPVCPALSGSFSSTAVGCDGPIVSALVTIDVDAACEATLTSVVSKALPPVNGMVSVRADGSFAATDLTIGATTRSCTGRAVTLAPLSYEIACVGGCTITLTPEP
jgi:hypothetical protein